MSPRVGNKLSKKMARENMQTVLMDLLLKVISTVQK